jgi:hypothetical protein
MRQISLILILFTSCLFLGGCSKNKKESGSLKIYRPPKSSYEETPPKTIDLDSHAVTKNAGQRLIGDWPQKAAKTDLDVQKVPIRQVFRSLAEFARINIVLADEVSGKISASIKNTSWIEILKNILEAKNLVAIKEGNVIRILRKEDWPEK